MVRLEDKLMPSNRMEQLADKIGCMGRPDLIQTLRGLQCDFQIDFSDDFLETLSIERLKHIVLAASLHDHQKA